MKLFSQIRNVWNKYQTTLNYIKNEIEKDLLEISDSELKSKTTKLKYFTCKNNYIDLKTLSEAFALTREASKRTINLRHYHVQILGGLVLDDGLK